MTPRDQYQPGPAAGARIEKSDGPKWALVLVRELRHTPEKVWAALTDPAQLREWAPFDADRSLATAGNTVKLTTVGAPSLHITETTVAHADPPRLLEYGWGDNNMRWELKPLGSGTLLTLSTTIHRGFTSMGASGWHICFDVLDRLLGETPIGRIIGREAAGLNGWDRLNADYAEQFGVKAPPTPPWAKKS